MSASPRSDVGQPMVVDLPEDGDDEVMVMEETLPGGGGDLTPVKSPEVSVSVSAPEKTVTGGDNGNAVQEAKVGEQAPVAVAGSGEGAASLAEGEKKSEASREVFTLDSDDDIVELDSTSTNNSAPVPTASDSSTTTAAAAKPAEAQNSTPWILAEETVENSSSSSDDSSVEIETEITAVARQKKHRRIMWQCLHPDCSVSRRDELVTAKPSMLAYFGLEKDNKKKRKICLGCQEDFLENQTELVAKVRRGESLTKDILPVGRDMVTLEDSDEKSETDSSDSSEFELDVEGDPGETASQLLDRIVNEAFVKYDIPRQVEKSCTDLMKRLEDLQPDRDETDAKFRDMEKQLEMMRKELYKDHEAKVEFLPELDIPVRKPAPPTPPTQRAVGPQAPAVGQHPTAAGQHPAAARQHHPGARLPPPGARHYNTSQANRPTHAVSLATKSTTYRLGNVPGFRLDHQQQQQQRQRQLLQQQQQQQLQQQQLAQQNLPYIPPFGELERPPVKLNETVFVMRYNVLNIWRTGKVEEILSSDTDGRVYKVKVEIMVAGKRTITTKRFSLKEMAYNSPAKFLLKVGVRCIGLYKDKQNPGGAYYSGIVAEPPKAMNKNRYLIFFDDGYASYVPHSEIRVVCQSSKNVWEDIHPNSREFIKSYIHQYPERPMVKLIPKQMVKTEWDGKWWLTRVTEVDASLVKLTFSADEREEWIYRGSTRLGPLYTEMEQQRQRREQEAAGVQVQMGFRRQAYRKQNQPIVEYTRAEVDADGAPTKKPGNVARKSTAGRRPEPASTPVNQPVKTWESQGTIEDISNTVKKPPTMAFTRHQCSSKCMSDPRYQYDGKIGGLNPLFIPCSLGWKRCISRTSKKNKKIFYVSPCGRRLRNLEEVHRYLRITGSKLEIDFFNFDWFCKVTTEFKVQREVAVIKDMSYGKENVPVSCVNSIDKSYPEYLEYSTVRIPKAKVFINTDKEFMISCDCEDDCQDRNRCKCHLLTIQETVGDPSGKVNPSAGYEYRRLSLVVLTGIYECNKFCKCGPTCLNRVVQMPLRQKLQVFKTARRGWGIRTLVDIPTGAYICIYVGNLYEGEEANKQGKNFGDEYFAELDMIEVMERNKEGYESDCSDIEEKETKEKEAGGGGLHTSQINLEPIRSDELSSDDDFSEKSDDKDFNPLGYKHSRVTSTAADRTTRRKAASSASTGIDQLDGHTHLSSSDDEVTCLADPNSQARMTLKWADRRVADVLGDELTNPDTRARICSLVAGIARHNPVTVDRNSIASNTRNGHELETAEDLTSAMADKHTAGQVDEDTPGLAEEDTPGLAEELTSGLGAYSQMDGNVDTSDDDMEGMDGKKSSQRRGGGFTAAAGITGPKKTETNKTFKSTRKYFGHKEDVYIMDAKSIGNIGRYLNHSCSPNVFVQNVFVDTHDLRFPWVAFFASNYIKAGQELCWDYNYEVGAVVGKEMPCECGSEICKGRLL